MSKLSIGSRAALVAATGGLAGISTAAAVYFGRIQASEEKGEGTCGLPSGQASTLKWMFAIVAAVGYALFLYSLYILYYGSGPTAVGGFLASEAPLGQAYMTARK